MKCIHCYRSIRNKGSLKAHELCCKQNPRRVKFRRGENTGVQKGTPSPLRGVKVGRAEHWDKKFPLDKIFVEGSTYPRHCLKKRIIDNNLILYKCAVCGIGPTWMERPMPLILDHTNGVNNDDRLKNLRFVCSNCDSQLPTYKSRNRNSGRLGERFNPSALKAEGAERCP